MNNKNIRERQDVYSTPWFKVVAKTVEGDDAPFYSLQLSDYVSILAVTQEQKILLVRQYRPAVERYTLELPSGHIERNEPPDMAAKRELLEETGYAAENVELIGKLIPDTGRLSNTMWCFMAENVVSVSDNPVLEEGISLVACSLPELQSYLVTNQFDHALHIAVIMLAVANHKLKLG